GLGGSRLVGKDGDPRANEDHVANPAVAANLYRIGVRAVCGCSTKRGGPASLDIETGQPPHIERAGITHCIAASRASTESISDGSRVQPIESPEIEQVTRPTY